MPTTATTGRPGAGELGRREREVLHAVGCGLRDDEIAAALATSEDAVAAHLARILGKLGLRDRAAAIVHAFDCGLVAPGRGPRAQPVRPAPRSAANGTAGPAATAGFTATSGPAVRIAVLGPLRAWRDGRSLDLGYPRRQAVLAALALRGGRALSRQELLDGVWGLEPPVANVVPVHIYRLRKILRIGDSPDSVIEHDRGGYRLVSGAAEVDLTRMEDLVTAAGTAHRAGDQAEAVRLCSQALDLFRGELLAGLPGPLAELERLRLAERRIAVAQRKLEWQLRLGRHAEAVDELFALSAEHPLNELVAAMLMRALYSGDRRADALAVFDRARRRLADDLGVPPGRMLRQTYRMVLRGDDAGPDLTGVAR
ncbi:BTAD domain-containing putative transcriptional regulator [Kitasatospora sp. NPDC048298]|uniref:BTAD domain-containing putative transcriptional regulator n=1 Tax=Kitasatospora sp. NPDC048298 TaxID=3364049 RepID=UPI003716544D